MFGFESATWAMRSAHFACPMFAETKQASYVGSPNTAHKVASPPDNKKGIAVSKAGEPQDAQAGYASGSDSEEELSALAALVARPQTLPNTSGPTRPFEGSTQRFVKPVMEHQSRPAASGAGGDLDDCVQDSSIKYDCVHARERHEDEQDEEYLSVISDEPLEPDASGESWPFAYREGAMTPPARLCPDGSSLQSSPAAPAHKTEPARPSSAQGSMPASALADLQSFSASMPCTTQQAAVTPPAPASTAPQSTPIPTAAISIPLAWGTAKTHTSFAGASHAYGIQANHVPSGNTVHPYGGPMWMPHMYAAAPQMHWSNQQYIPGYHFAGPMRMMHAAHSGYPQQHPGMPQPKAPAHPSAGSPRTGLSSTQPTASEGAAGTDDLDSSENTPDVVALWHLQQAEFHAAQARLHQMRPPQAKPGVSKTAEDCA